VSYRLVGEGEGSVTGFAKGNAAVELVDVAEGTRLTYRAEAQIGGKIAQLGQRLVSSTAKKITEIQNSLEQRKRKEVLCHGEFTKCLYARMCSTAAASANNR
jgi:carbon monoxide dehydrogenase subunit G